MAEEPVWRGSISQWKNSGLFVLQLLVAIAIVVIFVLLRQSSSPGIQKFSPYILLLLALPIFIATRRYLQTKCTIYEVTTERLKTSEGVLSKTTNTLEFYRVKDIERQQPFLYRLCGIENVQLKTSDAPSPLVMIEAVSLLKASRDSFRPSLWLDRSRRADMPQCVCRASARKSASAAPD